MRKAKKDMGSQRYIYIKRYYRYIFFCIDVIGNCIVKIISFFRYIEPYPEIKRILVVELAHMGDVLADTPALRLLRKKFPGAFISIAVGPWNREVISGNPDIDEIITYRASWFDRTQQRGFSIRETLKFIFSIRRKKFELGIDMRGDFRIILLLWLGGIKYRIGYGFAGGGFLLNNVIEFDVDKRQDTHQIDHNLNLIKQIPFGRVIREEECNRDIIITFSEEDISYIRGILSENHITERDFLIVIHPGSGIQSKRWPVERFAILIRSILDGFNVKIALVGGGEEVSLGRILMDSFNGRVINVIGKTTVKQVAALIKKAGLFIGGDSGLMHIASAVDTPIIAIWGGHNKPTLWKPLRERDIVIHKDVDCSPCGKFECSELTCLKQIDAGDVFEHVSAYLKGKGL